MNTKPNDEDMTPEQAAQAVAAASKLWRDKFNASKEARNKKMHGSGKGAAGAAMPNRFQKTKIGNVSQKTRKGSRAG